ncbi:hypothetical protein HY627_02125 [Candidatus Uhrbacteria bacterium]|nr:hypothetical protein [Candidatus Uhrbacteria bacterium]
MRHFHIPVQRNVRACKDLDRVRAIRSALKSEIQLILARYRTSLAVISRILRPRIRIIGALIGVIEFTVTVRVGASLILQSTFRARTLVKLAGDEVAIPVAQINKRQGIRPCVHNTSPIERAEMGSATIFP